MATTLLTGIYTLTPTHCGTGQTSGAVDLPIAREAHTGLPVLPASGLKGAARSILDEDRDDESKIARRLFGASVSSQKKENEKDSSGPESGSLVVLEGRLLFYPIRSLQRAFVYATCPMILERLARDLRALEIESPLGRQWHLPSLTTDGGPRALVADKDLAEKTLVLEDLVYKGTEVGTLEATTLIGDFAKSLLPVDEKPQTGARIEKNLVVLSDRDFIDLVQRVIPVQARIHLDDKTKTTSGDGGNLWYEESLPPDCLFTVLVTTRAGYKSKTETAPTEELMSLLARKKSIQIGGNETVGQGFCWWTTATSTGKGTSHGEG